MAYKYGDKTPTEISVDDLTDKQKELLFNSKAFCIYPWIHMHGYPTGEAYPCCHSEMEDKLGNLRENTMEEIWNDRPMRELRQSMLNDTKSNACKKCYEQEDAGFFSMRNSANKHFGHHVALATDKTAEDGTLEKFEIKYWDVRFSNLCNFKCRTCGGIFSSKWWEDDNKLYGPLKTPRTQYAGKDQDDIWNQMLPHLDYVEQIYFAGGEPLLMEEHYRVLEELIRRERFDVRLVYNTNFSTVNFKGKKVLEMWKLFKTVSVGASIDANGERAEYSRWGTKWDVIENNRKQMLEICPNVDFYISPTLSVFTAYNIVDLHRDWVEKGFIKPDDLNVNICLSPEYYRIDMLPAKHKAEVTKLYEDHIAWLEGQDHLGRATIGYRSAIKLMNEQDQSFRLKQFFERTDKLDSIRNEKFEDIYPEYHDLRSYI